MKKNNLLQGWGASKTEEELTPKQLAKELDDYWEKLDKMTDEEVEQELAKAGISLERLKQGYDALVSKLNSPKTAKFLKQVDFGGKWETIQELWELSDYGLVTVSSISKHDLQETLVFKADKDGAIQDFLEVFGSSGRISAYVLLKERGYTIIENT